MDNTKVLKEKKTKWQKTIYKDQDGKLKTEQQEPHQKSGCTFQRHINRFYRGVRI